MITVRQIAIGLLADGILSQADEKLLRRDYCHKTITGMQRKNSKLMKSKVFPDAYTIAVDGWKLAQNSVEQNVSTVMVFKYIVDKEPWLLKYYKLNQKYLDKMYNACDNTTIQLRSMRAARLGIEGIDKLVANYNYRKSKEDK